MSKELPAVVVKDLYKSFKLPHEQHSGIKQLIVNFAKRKKGYEIQQVLNGVSFEIKKGEFFGIVGRNGSGKSTLLKLLAGIYTPDQGLVQVNGSLTPFIELGVGFNPELTGRENVFMNGALLGFSRKEMEAKYDDIVAFSELDRFMDQKLKNYSSGMQVRLAFSIAIRAKSDILILDEVLAVGDQAFQQKCFTYFEDLRKQGQTMILVTHDMSAVKRFCDRAVLIEDGYVKIEGKPDEIADQYLLDNIVHDSPEQGNEGVYPDSPVQELSMQLKDEKKSYSSKDILLFDISYRLNKKFSTYVGYSIIKDGVSITEMNTLEFNLPSKPGETLVIGHSLPLRNFNPGLYKIDVAIFRRSDKALLEFKLKCAEFLIEGNDDTRGGAMRSDGEWEEVK